MMNSRNIVYAKDGVMLRISICESSTANFSARTSLKYCESRPPGTGHPMLLYINPGDLVVVKNVPTSDKFTVIRGSPARTISRITMTAMAIRCLSISLAFIINSQRMCQQRLLVPLTENRTQYVSPINIIRQSATSR